MGSFKNREDLEKLNKLVSLKNQVKLLRLEYKLGKQNIHDDMKKLFDPVTEPIKDVSQDATMTLTEISKENKKALENLNHKLLEMLKNTGQTARHLMPPLSRITIPEHTSQFNLI